jgi:hypothetical protein
MGGTGEIVTRVLGSEDADALAPRYEIEVRNWLLRHSTMAFYEGGVVDGRAHGFGSWMDSAQNGELLSGWWERGVPVGPFDSTENTAGTLLANVRVIFATCNAPGSQGLALVNVLHLVEHTHTESCACGRSLR